MVRDDMSGEFPAFALAFDPEPLGTGAYLVLLNLGRHHSEAVLIVARCLDAAKDKRIQVGNLLRGSLGALNQPGADGAQRAMPTGINSCITRTGDLSLSGAWLFWR